MTLEQPNLIVQWCPPAEFLEWKVKPGAGLVIQAYYKYAAWDYRRFNLEGVPSSARFIEERVRDDIRVGKRRGVDLDGYTLNSHLTKPILMHMLTEHPEWRRMFQVRNNDESGAVTAGSGWESTPAFACGYGAASPEKSE